MIHASHHIVFFFRYRKLNFLLPQDTLLMTRNAFEFGSERTGEILNGFLFMSLPCDLTEFVGPRDVAVCGLGAHSSVYTTFSDGFFSSEMSQRAVKIFVGEFLKHAFLHFHVRYAAGHAVIRQTLVRTSFQSDASATKEDESRSKLPARQFSCHSLCTVLLICRQDPSRDLAVWCQDASKAASLSFYISL